MPPDKSSTGAKPKPKASPYSKQERTPSSSPDVKPIAKPKTEPEPKARKKRSEGGRPWTGEEKIQLFRFAMERNGRNWGEAVPDRTASQSSQTWKVTLVTFIERVLRS